MASFLLARGFLLLVILIVQSCHASTRSLSTNQKLWRLLNSQKEKSDQKERHDLSPFLHDTNMNENWKIFFQDTEQFFLEKPKKKLSKRQVDYFHFKGFGLSFYKSFLKLRNCGIAFRIPVLSNFEWWDRQPMLPSFTINLCVFLPLRLSVGFSTSMDVQAIKFVLIKGMTGVVEAGRLLTLQMLRLVIMVISIIAFPIHGKLLQPKPSQSYKTLLEQVPQKPQYKTGMQERLGCTLWYRWSPTKGLDKRWSYWHMYLPTVRACQKALLPNLELPNWCHENFASLGTDATLTSSKELFLTGLLSLSGIHLPQKSKNEAISGSPNAVIVTNTAVQQQQQKHQPPKDQRHWVPVKRGGNLEDNIILPSPTSFATKE
jgi:hypothetical protein